MIDKIINQADIPKNLTSNLNKNCHSSSPKPWSLLEKKVKHCIIGKKISRFRHLKGREYFYYAKYSKVPNKRGVLISRGLEICVKYNKRGSLEYPGGRKMVNKVPLRLVWPSRHLLHRKWQRRNPRKI